MDYLKRELYMRAVELIETKQSDFICHALRDATNELGKYSFFSQKEIATWFPEFIALNDGVAWTTSCISGEPASVPQEHEYSAWFTLGVKERKLRLQVINTILAHRCGA